MKKNTQLWTTIILLISLISCKGQNQINQKESNKKQIEFESPINLTNDAPNAITRTIIQDKKGNIWFTTFEGVIKYTENSFTNMTKNVSSSRFFSALEDRQGNLWFGSIGSGVFLYDGESFQNFTTDNGLVDNSVTNIYEDKTGNIWFGTIKGVSRYDGQFFQNFTTKQGLLNDDVNSIIEDKTGKFWLGTRGEAFTYDGKSFSKITTKQGESFGNVRHIIKDKNDEIWLGGNDGLWRYDGENFKNITNDFVGYIYEDKKGNIWTSSESKNAHGWLLSCYDAKSLNDEKAIVTKIKTGERMFFGILEDSDENIWVGTLNGIYRYDGNTFDDFKK